MKVDTLMEYHEEAVKADVGTLVELRGICTLVELRGICTLMESHEVSVDGTISICSSVDNEIDG